MEYTRLNFVFQWFVIIVSFDICAWFVLSEYVNFDTVFTLSLLLSFWRLLKLLDGDVRNETGEKQPTKTILIDEREDTSRSIPLTWFGGRKDMVFPYSLKFDENKPFLFDVYKKTKIKNKAKKTTKFCVRGLILPGDTKAKNPVDVDVPESKIYKFVYIGYQLEQNPSTRKSAYGLTMWTVKKRYDKLVYYGCIHLLVSNDLLISRRRGFGGKARYKPRKTMEILLGE
jgi:hypothetical protein